jgi:DNA-binding NarL/FixJ family response regulator
MASRDTPRGLTDRELAVVRLIAQGRTRAEVAGDLHIAPGTVDSHVQSAYRKTGTASHAQLTLWLQDGAQ